MPESLIDRVKRLIERKKDLGYVSVSEFVKEAVRLRLEEVEKSDRK